MFRWVKEIDAIVIIMIFTIMVGVVVVTLRSRTYYIGYEIANLKNEEKKLREQNGELQIELVSLQRDIRKSLLEERDAQGELRFIFPDVAHVVNQKGK